MNQREFYQEQDLSGVNLSVEVQSLLSQDREGLSQSAVKRLNRLLNGISLPTRSSEEPIKEGIKLPATVKALLIEDEPPIRRLYEVNLIKAGFEVILADDGVDALSRLEQIVPDIIICDINMPRMNGFQLREILLKDDLRKNIPFLFLTARSSGDDIIHGLDLEIDDYIIKTSGPKMLIAKIQNLLKKRNQTKKVMTEELSKASKETSILVAPKAPPKLAGYNIVQWHEPHEGVPGGDFFDYVPIDDHRLFIVLGDVTGKRWKAWTFAHAYVSYIRNTIRSLVFSEESSKNITPARIIDHLNRILLKDLQTSEVLCTLIILMVDSQSNKVLLSNAAHLPAIHYNKKSGDVQEITESSIFAGFSEETIYNDADIIMSTGDKLMIFTDGLTETFSPQGLMFGMSNVTQIFLNSSNIDTSYLPDVFRQSLINFADKNTFDDDLTMLIIEKVD